MKECSKAVARRLADSRFVRRYFVGRGLDIGGRPDPLAQYRELFPMIESVRTWDLEDGDAQYLKGVADGEFDFVHSSHCLEHLREPQEALCNWLRVVKPGGYLVVSVPDEDLYEQGAFPSTYNADHKHTFTIYKDRSWNPRSINLLDLIRSLGGAAAIERIELLDVAYRYALPRYDQSLTPVAESGIEFVIRKRTEAQLAGDWRREPSRQPERETRLHLNQYRDDHRRVREGNSDAPPFTNDKEL
ncbi:MAG: class I SAM-dependent methyltransferase [Gammaproteobacteria bacterium]|nr:class I SAM-dependent methyltransferase [Gammaproteobacteria bacterium]